jgi:hypothetical protein
VGHHRSLRWGQVEVPVAEAAHGVGDVGGYRGQIDRVGGMASAARVLLVAVMSTAVE